MPDPIAVFDGHNDILLKLYMNADARRSIWDGSDGRGHLDLPRMQAGGFAGGFFAIYVPSPADPDAPDMMALMAEPPYDLPLPDLIDAPAAQPVALAQAGLMHWMARESADAFALCRTADEARAAMAAGQIAGVMHMEGTEAIGADLDALYLFHQMGLRSLGPVWSRPTIFGHGVPFAFPGDPDTGPGLTDAGRDLVRICDALGIIVDLSHMNAAGVDDVAKISTKPLVATHSNVHALCPSPRNLTNRQLAMIRDTGGMVGLNFATFFLAPDGRGSDVLGLDAMARHLDYLIEALGEGHVGFGSDFDLSLIHI